MQSTSRTNRWLIAAGLYNLLWGAWVIALPHAMFDWTGMPRLNRPEIWQCVGMIVGVYGIGYLIAARDSVRHWPIVLVGLLGKIFGPIGFAKALAEGTFPPIFGLNILTNDVVWWIPFTMILWNALRENSKSGDPGAVTLNDALHSTRNQRGSTLADITDAAPALVVALRHSGCCFCRETLTRLRECRGRIPQGMEIVIVTMSSPAKNATLADKFQLSDVHWVSDPERRMYTALELQRGTFSQLFGLKVVYRGLSATMRGSSVGSLDGDGFQMPGAFIVHRSKIVKAFRSQSAADSPNFEQFTCEVGG